MSNRRAKLEDNSPLDQLFSPTPAPRTPATRRETVQEPAAPPKRRRTTRRRAEPAAEAPANAGPLKQTTLLLYEEQSDWLDEQCYRARRRGGKRVTKANIIRALIDIAREHDVRLHGAGDDDEVRARLKTALNLD